MASRKQQKMEAKKKAMEEKARRNKDLFREPPNFPKQKFTATLPIPPSVNHLYRYVHGRKFLTKQAVQYYGEVSRLIEEEIGKQNFKKEGEAVWLILEIKCFRSDRRRFDLHNTHKALCDALEGQLFIDDRYVLVRDMNMSYDADNPRIEIVLYPHEYKEEW